VASVQQVLTAIAEAIRTTGQVAGVQVVVADPPRDAASLMGSAGFSPDPVFFSQLRDARTRGARLATFDGPVTLDQRIIPDRRDRMLADGAWMPLHPYLRQVEWRDYVATPIPLRRERGGVVNAYLDPSSRVTARLLEFLRAMARVAATAIEPLPTASELPPAVIRATERVDDLTAREREVLALLGVGLSNRDLAARLGISERTARTHASNILARLGLPSRTQAALVAQAAGIRPPR
jgi:DNA-binding CsgD family transcriptional regulator